MEDKYSRQERLEGWNQGKIVKGKVTIIGIGSLGTIVADLLARAGVGEIYLVDHDVVEESNLTRQVLYSPSDIGKTKVDAAKKRLEEINPEVEVHAYPMKLGIAAKQHNEIFKSNVVVDCLDNLEARLQLNEECVNKNVPLVSGGIYGLLGQVQVVIPYKTPCLNCNPFISQSKVIGDSCSKNDKTPYINSTASVVAGILAQEVYKILQEGGIGKPTDKYVRYVIDQFELNEIPIKRKKSCKICGGAKNATRTI